MKLTKKTSVLLAVALAAVLSSSAYAQNVFNQGDLLIGFEQAGNASNYVVDLGNFSQFTTGTALTFNLSTADLSATFGSTWNSNSQTNLVHWGVIGNDSNTDDLFYTKGRTVAGTQSTAPNRLASSNQQGVESNLAGLQTGSFTGFSGSTPSAGSTLSLQATVQTAADSNSWSSGDPQNTGFGLGSNIEQSKTSLTGPTNSVLDLYESVPRTAAGQKATYLGNFTLDSSTGTLSFNVAVAPEPSTLGLMALGFAFMAVIIVRRKGASNL